MKKLFLTLVIFSGFIFNVLSQDNSNANIKALQIERLQFETQYKIDTLTSSAHKAMQKLQSKGQDSAILIKYNSGNELLDLKLAMQKEMDALNKKYGSNLLVQAVNENKLKAAYAELENKYERQHCALETKYDSLSNALEKALDLKVDSIEESTQAKIKALQKEYDIKAAKIMAVQNQK